MTEFFQDNPRHLLVAIRYEFYHEKPPFEAYRSLCETFGNDAISFKDFDFWWYRFEKGLFDIDHDRSQEPKTHDFSDIPEKALTKILDKLEWEERCIFRKVSRKYRRAVDNHRYVYKNVEFRHAFSTTLKIDNAELRFYRLPHRNIARRDSVAVEMNGIKTRAYIYTYDIHAVNELLIAFENPNMQIKNFKWDLTCFKFNKKVKQLLESLEHYVNVECFELRIVSQEYEDMISSDDSDASEPRERDEVVNVKVEEHLMMVLPALNPGFLEKIILTGQSYYCKFPAVNTEEVGELDQWREAKHLETNIKVPIEDVIHFERLVMTLDSISVEEVLMLKDGFLNSPNFEYCRLNLNTHNVRRKLESVGFELNQGGIQFDVSWNSIEFKRN